MRYRIIFVVGVAVGFVLGARAGRERYEQLKRLARKAADNPSVQQAAAAAQAQATEFARTARERVTEQVPKIAGSARNRIGDKLPGHQPGSRAGSASGPSPDGQSYARSPDPPQP
jgi:uncharacterized membrane protein